MILFLFIPLKKIPVQSEPLCEYLIDLRWRIVSVSSACGIDQSSPLRMKTIKTNQRIEQNEQQQEQTLREQAILLTSFSIDSIHATEEKDETKR